MRGWLSLDYVERRAELNHRGQRRALRKLRRVVIWIRGRGREEHAVDRTVRDVECESAPA